MGMEMPLRAASSSTGFTAERPSAVWFMLATTSVKLCP